MSTTLNPYCHVESPFQTSFSGLASYVIPKIDVLISGVYRDRPILNGTPNNASTDQLGGSLPANLTLHTFGLTLFLAAVGLGSGAPFVDTLPGAGALFLAIAAARGLGAMLVGFLAGQGEA